MSAADILSWEPEELTRVRISMAPPLRWVNSYLLRGDEGVTIVDPGPRSQVTEEEWRTAWNELGMTPSDISGIVLTHHHPDHYGLAGYLQSLSGAQVFMSRRAHEESMRMWGEGSGMNEALLQLYCKHGMPRVWYEQLPLHLESFLPEVTPDPVVTYLAEGETIVMGGRNWTGIESAGHAPGHLSFYDPERRLMLCGDAVLPQISPNVSLLPGSDPQPLKSFLDSLIKLGAYEVDKAFPGHRNPFPHFAERTRALLAHHEERLDRIEAILAERDVTGFDVCAALFGLELGIHQMRFAMSETLAHLTELVRRGRAAEIGNPDGSRVFRIQGRHESSAK
ncbi:glyoxylase-like metal-dependent hydrolase (beta-lactamase superfamily II) [Fontibacillus phaseoli]|uniref:Glyoxylase-like metal-dependent hydrolase (Beta-lactamase superfamily II) n=1 Tax=Fontibacillus phaseoli TaxID=1416533 RepID=A0A369BGX4_9BACL|nr:MBL fold metallo-hydrolase [Fontibacillus phaseoli]RCX19816.1 glyoxylase-like metal-dependent hydrolase (beta-lactamase superfamily II) [Fontibacillus phaseoli]